MTEPNPYMFKFQASVVLILLLSLANIVSGQEFPLTKFQIYLWPGEMNTSARQVPTSNHSVKHDDNPVMKAYVAPQIAYSPNADDEVQSITAARKRVSPTYLYQGPQPLHFFIPNGSLKTTLGKVNLPEGTSEALLLFFPTSTGQYSILPIDVSPEKIPDGKAFVYNLSDQPIACLLNDQKIALLPNASHLAKLGPEENLEAIIRIGAQDTDGNWAEQYAQRLHIDPKSSVLLVIYKNPNRGNSFRIMQIKNER